MLNLKTLTIGILIAALAGPVSAHSSHARSEPVTQQEASVRADQVIDSLLSQNKLDRSWEEVAEPETSQHETSAGKVWVVRYNNSEESDTSKNVLYVYIDEMGNVLTASHDDKL